MVISLSSRPRFSPLATPCACGHSAPACSHRFGRVTLLSIEPKLEQEIVAGDIVLVARQNRFFIHRLIEKHDSCWITRGDSLPQNDDSVASCDVLGRVSLIHKRTRVIVPSQCRSLFSRALAWMLCHSDTFRTIALRVHSLCHFCSAGIPRLARGRLCRLSRGHLALASEGGTPSRQPPRRRRYTYYLR